MLRPVVILLALFATAHADPVTVMGENILPRTDLVVRGVPGKTERLGLGASVTRFSIAEVVKGRQSGDSVLILTADPSFFGGRGSRVVFLHHLSGDRYQGVACVRLDGADADQKFETLRKYLRIEAIPNGDEKRKALHDLLMHNLTSGRKFLVYSAARELAHFTERNSARFTADDAATIRSREKVTTDPLLKGLLETTLRHLGGLTKGSKRKAHEEKSLIPVDIHGVPAPREFRKMARAFYRGIPLASDRQQVIRAAATVYVRYAKQILLAALDDPDPQVRAIAAFGLGEGLVDEAKVPLRNLLSREKDVAVQKAAIRTLGYLRDKDALFTVIRFGQNSDLLETCVFAAARIGGAAADDWLATLRAQHSGDSAADRALRRTLDFLASPDFRRQEEILRKIRLRRMGRE